MTESATEASGMGSEVALDHPLVSVVVPVHGRADYLETTLGAIRDQTYQPIEVVIVNERAVGDLASRVNRILPGAVILDSTGPGPGTARNSGLARATGQFVAFLDCDDVWLPEFVSALVQALTASPSAGFAGCTFVQFDKRGPRAVRPVRRTKPGQDAVRSILIEYMFPPSVVLSRRDVVDRIGGWGDYDANEDRVFFGRMAVAAPFVHVDRSLALYRLHQDSRSQHGPAVDPYSWYRAWRRANATVLSEIESSPRKTRLERDLDAIAPRVTAQFHLIAGNRRSAIRAGLKAVRLAPTAREPYFVMVRAILGDRVARVVRRAFASPFPDDTEERVRRANQPMGSRS
jgi:glycosyltransferase involved in cell wall biosynthesis